MAETIKILVVEPMEKPKLLEIEHTLENLQGLVGGYIQAVYPYDDPVALICDDEAKLKGYAPNRMLVGEDGEPYELISGTFLITGLTRDDFGSLSEELAEKYMEMFRWPELLMRTLDGHVLWIWMKPGEEPKVIV